MPIPPVKLRWSRIPALGVFVALMLATELLAGPQIVGHPAVVRSGQVVRVRWDAPSDAEELELLLLLDGGAREPLRLTRCLSGRTGSWRWRVPDLPAASARLVLRWGDGRREIEGQPGPAFVIVCRSRRLAPLASRGGELWLELGAAPSIPPRGRRPSAEAAWPTGMTVPAILPGHPILPRPGFPACEEVLISQPAAAGGPAPDPGVAPPFLPQRE